MNERPAEDNLASSAQYATDPCLGRPLWRQWPFIPIPVLFIAIIGLLFVNTSAHASPALLIVLNLLLASLPALIIAALFARGFLASGAPGLLAFGCGALLWSASGLSSLVFALAPGHGFDANVSVTIHNVSVWTAALCYLAGAALLERWDATSPRRAFHLVAGYALAVVAATLIIAMVLANLTPVFFVQGAGATMVRQFVLVSTIAALVLTLVLLWPHLAARDNRFLNWFALALLLLIAGYVGIAVQTVFDGVGNWVGRAAQFLGGVYMMVAATYAFRTQRALPAPLPGPGRHGRAPEAVAIVAVLTAAVLRLVFLPQLTGFAFITFYPAVVLGALYGGLRAGATATILSALIAEYFWMEPAGSLIVAHPVDWAALAVFVATCLILSLLAERLRRAEARQKQELEALVAERTVALTNEIAERKRTEGALRETEERLTFALSAARAGFWESRLDTGEFIASDQALALNGLPPGTKMTQELALAATYAEDRPRVLAAIDEARRTGAPYNLELRSQHPDGSIHWLHTRGALRNKGVAPRFVGLVQDITARKKTEEELALAKAEAERANTAKSKFLATASHDLRQPVQSLTLLLSALERQVKDKPKAMNMVTLANTSMDSLNCMLTGILDISRLDAGVITPTFASADVGELVDRLADEYVPRAAAIGLELRHVTHTLLVRTDVALLERILRNLIENALRYTAKGGVLIGARRRGERVRLDVIDTGVGIPSGQQAEIFEEFRQLNNRARDADHGLGLGLAIVSRLARIIGAEVEVASRVGRGTRFSLLIPLDRAAATPIRVAPAFDDASGRILIIEDDSGVRQAYEIMLADWGYDTLSAASGEEALDFAAQEEWRFDAIVADHRLGPGLTGNAAAKEIARRAGRHFPTLLVTGDTAGERLTEVSSSGFALLHKPIEAEELRRALASLMRATHGEVPHRPTADDFAVIAEPP